MFNDLPFIALPFVHYRVYDYLFTELAADGVYFFLPVLLDPLLHTLFMDVLHAARTFAWCYQSIPWDIPFQTNPALAIGALYVIVGIENVGVIILNRCYFL